MPTNFRVSSDIDTFLRKATKEQAAEFLVGATYAPINNPTFTGIVGIPTADFNVGNSGGELSWNNQEKTLDLATGSNDVTIQLGQETVIFARNNSGVQINDGENVMLTGSVGNKPAVSKGDASNSVSAHKIIGIATQNIGNNSDGFITIIGKVRGINLPNASFSEGDIVYADPTVAGGLTTTKPQIEVELGIVLKTGGNGEIEVNTNNEAALFDLKQELTRDLNIKDSLTITADQTPDDNAKLLMIDKSTPTGRNGALEKIDGRLYVGPSEDLSAKWKLGFETLPSGNVPVMDFPTNGALRLGSTNTVFKQYQVGTFLPKLESGDGTVVQSEYALREAKYIKIDQLVYVNIHIRITNFIGSWKSSTKNWRLTGFPFDSSGDNYLEIRPIRGWLDKGNDNIYGYLGSNNDYMWFEESIDAGSVAGQGNNTSRINANDFVTHPFNFSSGAFEFVIIGSYKTTD